jgi:hypothetical protein
MWQRSQNLFSITQAEPESLISMAFAPTIPLGLFK